MARISINKASLDFKVSRNTLYKHISIGKLSKDSNGKVDTSDLIRLYGEHTSTQQQVSPIDTKYEQSILMNDKQVQLLQQQVQQLQQQVALLTAQLEYTQKNEQWLKEQLDQKRIEHKSNNKGILGRLFR